MKTKRIIYCFNIQYFKPPRIWPTTGVPATVAGLEYVVPS